MNVDKGQLIIDVHCIDQLSYEALEDIAEKYSYAPVGKLIQQWLDNTRWDIAAWYIGDDL